MRSHLFRVSIASALALLPIAIACQSASPNEGTAQSSAREATVSASSSAAPLHVAADARTFRGLVLTPDGAPARDVPVRVRGWTKTNPAVEPDGFPRTWIDVATHTQSDGSFELRCAPPGDSRYLLEVRPVDHVACAWLVQSLAAGATRDVGTVTLERGGTITGRIVDARARPLFGRWDAGAVREGQQFEKERIAAPLQTLVESTTGSFVLENVPPGRVQPYAVSRVRWVIGGEPLDLRAGETAHIELSFDGPDLSRRISVGITADPFPFAAPRVAGVKARGPGGEYELVPNEGGDSFAADDLEPGEYTLSIADPAFEPWSASGIRTGTVTTATLRSRGALALRVVDRDNGAPIEHYAALVHYDDKPWSSYWQPLVTAEPRTDGVQLFTGLPAGDLDLVVRAEGRCESKLRVAEFATAERRELVVKLSAGAVVTGRVVDADGHSPVANVEVWIVRADEPEGRWIGEAEQSSRRITQTTADGRFRFDGLPNSDYRLTALHGLFVVSPALEVARSSADSGDDVVLTLPPWGRVHGRIHAPSSGALTDLRLSFWPKEMDIAHGNVLSMHQFRDGGRLTSELRADGSFTSTPLPAGRCRAALKLPDFSIQGFGISARAAGADIALGEIEVRAGEDRAVELAGDFELPGRLDVRVRAEGATGQRYQVDATNVDPRIHSTGMGVTDETGALKLGPLLPGDYWISVRALGDAWSYVEPRQVHVESLREPRIELALVRSRGVLTVRDEDGPIASTRLCLKSAIEPHRFADTTVYTNERGELDISLPSGKWRIAAYSGSQSSFSDEEREAAEELRPHVEFEWTKDGPVPATVTLPR